MFIMSALVWCRCFVLLLHWIVYSVGVFFLIWVTGKICKTTKTRNTLISWTSLRWRAFWDCVHARTSFCVALSLWLKRVIALTLCKHACGWDHNLLDNLFTVDFKSSAQCVTEEQTFSLGITAAQWNLLVFIYIRIICNTRLKKTVYAWKW